jgi:tetratricopeptide (TPR) repeat protein
VTDSVRELRERAAAARAAGDRVGLAVTLVALAEATPLFQGAAPGVAAMLDDPQAFGTGEASADAVAGGAYPLPPDLAARRSMRRAQALAVSGRGEEAVGEARRAAVLAVETDDPDLARRGRLALCEVLARTGASPGEAAGLARALSRDAQRAGNTPEGRAFLAAVASAEGDLALNREDFAEARTHVEEALHRMDALDAVPDDLRLHVLQALSLVHQRQNNPVRALNRLERGLDVALRHDARAEVLECRFAVANLRTGLEHYDEALEQLEAAIALADAEEALQPWRLGLRLLKVTNLLCLGRHAEGRALAAELLDGARRAGDPLGQMQAAALLSAGHRAEGNHEEGYRVLSYAAARLEVAGHTEAGGLVRRMIGEMRDQLGHGAFDAMAERMAEAELARRREKK